MVIRMMISIKNKEQSIKIGLRRETGCVLFVSIKRYVGEFHIAEYLFQSIAIGNKLKLKLKLISIVNISSMFKCITSNTIAYFKHKNFVYRRYKTQYHAYYFSTLMFLFTFDTTGRLNGVGSLLYGISHSLQCDSNFLNSNLDNASLKKLFLDLVLITQN